jgi:hypothetical protein
MPLTQLHAEDRTQGLGLSRGERPKALPAGG